MLAYAYIYKLIITIWLVYVSAGVSIFNAIVITLLVDIAYCVVFIRFRSKCLFFQQ